MNAKQKIHKAQLTKWLTLFDEQAASGLTVKAWCAANNISIHKYNYWKHAAKEAYIDSMRSSQSILLLLLTSNVFTTQ